MSSYLKSTLEITREVVLHTLFVLLDIRAPRVYSITSMENSVARESGYLPFLFREMETAGFVLLFMRGKHSD